MKINKKQFKQWIAALDSGKYLQGNGYLNPYKDEYCCLGVACKVLIPENKIKLNICLEVAGALPQNQPHAPNWLIMINEDFLKKTGYSIVALNDGGEFSFTEIATLLELVYIHKILD